MRIPKLLAARAPHPSSLRDATFSRSLNRRLWHCRAKSSFRSPLPFTHAFGVVPTGHTLISSASKGKAKGAKPVFPAAALPETTISNKFKKTFKKKRKKVLTNPLRGDIIVKLAREQRTLKTIQSKETQTTVNKLELLLL